MKHKIRYTTILLTFIFCTIPVVCTLMMHHLNLTETLSKMGSGSFGRSNSLIKVHGEISTTDLIQSLNSTHTRCALYIDEVTDDGTVRNIYFSGRYVQLPMKSGRFLTASDFTEAFPVAVVGKSREDEVYVNRAGQQCVSVHNIEYVVLGVIGYEQATILDDYIYLNLNSLDNVDSPLLIVDYFSSKASDLSSELFMEDLEKHSVNSELLSGSVSYSESIMPQIVSARWFISIIACCFICLLLVSAQWINSQKKEVIVRMLVGASSRDIVILIAKKYLCIAILSFVIGSLYCTACYPAYTVNLLYGYALSIFFVVAFSSWSLHYFLHLDIQEALK